jgi:hypothetical protein
VCTGFWLGNLRERDHWGDPHVDGRIILTWIIRKWEGVLGTGWSWLRIGAGDGRFGHGEDPLGSENVGNFLTSCRTS